MNSPANILFLCTGNSCRSQMAEGFANVMYSGVMQAHSAGTAPGPRVDPRAVAVMREIGVDISNGKPKHVDDLGDVAFDLVVTVCDQANEHCPVFPGSTTRIMHRGFDDPPRLAFDAESEEQALAHYRRVRDEIRDFVTTLPSELSQAGRS